MKRIALLAVLLCLGLLSGITTPMAHASNELTLTATTSEDACFTLIWMANVSHVPGYCLGGEDGTCESDNEGTDNGQYCLQINLMDDSGGGHHPYTYCCGGWSNYEEQVAGVTYHTPTSAALLVLANTEGRDDNHRLLAGDRIMPPCGGGTKQKLAMFSPEYVVHFQVLRFINRKPQMFDAVGVARTLQTASLRDGQVLTAESFLIATGHQKWDFIPAENSAPQP